MLPSILKIKLILLLNIISFFKKSFQETTIDDCVMKILINEIHDPPMNQSFIFTQFSQQKSEYKLKSNYQYQINCLSKTKDFQLQRITIVDANQPSNRKILNNHLNALSNQNGEIVSIWNTNLTVNDEFNFTKFYIECAHYDPICIQKFHFSVENNKFQEKINQKQFLKPIILILSSSVVLTILMVILRMFYTINNKKQRNIYKKKHSNRLKKRSQSIQISTKLQEFNKLSLENNSKQLDGVLIPIIIESKIIN
jgi:hypothetical protein